ncbi:unnamed protein product, partial [Rotaria sp. Silwood2]
MPFKQLNRFMTQVAPTQKHNIHSIKVQRFSAQLAYFAEYLVHHVPLLETLTLFSDYET